MVPGATAIAFLADKQANFAAAGIWLEMDRHAQRVQDTEHLKRPIRKAGY